MGDLSCLYIRLVYIRVAMRATLARGSVTVMTIETPQIMKVMTVSPSSPTLLPRGEKGGW
ncbi:MAG: hypothetical protein DVS81_13545 [Candidatus Accumulibacter meliphilus]|uniref:Uncharacterized protein n=1 Tax=Candidatus Accumulibacter meliphilus TaxID=2211374 RepID=A0A369XKW4_9PROT|nr:MAG: hypothetical protein DVS81_13545 [Candidatus Accumulibacter meliphilus]